MAHNITANDDAIAYGIKKIMVDSKAELKELPYKLAPGSKALDISTMDLYLLNNHNTWVKIKNLKNGENPGGDGDNPGDGEEGDKLYIWDGGDI